MALTTDHKEGKATVKTVYFTSKTLADGSHPFMVRITKNRKLKYIATGLSLHPKYWNENKHEIRKSYPEPDREKLINALSSWAAKYADAANSLAVSDEVHDVKDVANKAIEGRKQNRRSTLLAYIDELIVNLKKAGQEGNSLVYKDLKNQLREFIESQRKQTTDVRFDAVTVKFCNELETYLRARGNADTTLSNRFRTLRAVLNKAIGEGVASVQNYPFTRSVSDTHKFSVGKFDTTTQKRAISRDDVRRVEAYKPIGSQENGPFADLRNSIQVEREQRAKDVFLFSFYVGGINFVDLAQLRWRNINTDSEGNYRLIYIRQKTNGKFSLRLLGPAVSIIESYRSLTYNSPDSYVFPILNTNKHKTPAQIKNRLKKIIGQVNDDLSTIGEQIGIATHLTTYVARHSFATSLKRSGISTAVISATMGHKTEAITNVYLDSFASETIDLAYDALLR